MSGWFDTVIKEYFTESKQPFVLVSISIAAGVCLYFINARDDINPSVYVSLMVLLCLLLAAGIGMVIQKIWDKTSITSKEKALKKSEYEQVNNIPIQGIYTLYNRYILQLEDAKITLEDIEESKSKQLIRKLMETGFFYHGKYFKGVYLAPTCDARFFVNRNKHIIISILEKHEAKKKEASEATAP